MALLVPASSDSGVDLKEKQPPSRLPKSYEEKLELVVPGFRDAKRLKTGFMKLKKAYSGIAHSFRLLSEINVSTVPVYYDKDEKLESDLKKKVGRKPKSKPQDLTQPLQDDLASALAVDSMEAIPRKRKGNKNAEEEKKKGTKEMKPLDFDENSLTFEYFDIPKMQREEKKKSKEDRLEEEGRVEPKKVTKKKRKGEEESFELPIEKKKDEDKFKETKEGKKTKKGKQ